MKNYKNFIETKIKIIAALPRVLDVGGGARFQKWLAPYKNYFINCLYETMDVDPTSGADIIGDIHHIPLPDNSVPGIICHSVLEHVEDPLRAMAELKRILAPGGKIFMYIPSVYPYHARHGVYPDYWRFFDDTVQLLFKGFRNIEIMKRGGYFTALSFFIPLRSYVAWFVNPIVAFLDIVFVRGRNTTAGYYIFAEK